MRTLYHIFCFTMSSVIYGGNLSIFEIELSGLITNPKQEISGMDWFENRLFFLPENQNGFLFSLEKNQIIAAIENQDTMDQKPLTPKQTKFNAPNYSDLIPGFEGFEGISFVEDNIYITVEAENDGIMESYLIWGDVDRSTYAVTIPRKNLKNIKTPIQVKNMTYESIVTWNKKIYAIFEANGANLQKQATQKALSIIDKTISQIDFPSIEYRITDATKVDNNGKFWCINYFWPGDKKLLKPKTNATFNNFEKKDGPKDLDAVERLIELEIKNNEIIISNSEPIQLILDENDSRNWEGVARLDDMGFLLATDKYPRMIFGFIAN